MGAPLSHFTYRTPLGNVAIASDGTTVTAVVFDQSGASLPKEIAASAYVASAPTNACANQLLEYLAGKRTALNVVYTASGSDFERSVWEAIGNIPYGQMRSAAEIAQIIGSPSSYRLVGRAAQRSPLAVVIPTHRLVSPSRKNSSSGNARLLAFNERLRLLEQRHALA